MQVPFAEWLPDLPDHLNPGATVALNVYPAVNSYRPWKAIQAQPNISALATRVHGAAAFKDDGGTSYIFAGKADKLYRLSSNTFNDISGSQTFGTTVHHYWDFIKFGEDIIAFNGNETPQKFTMGTSSNFSALTNAPAFRHAAVVNNFVVTGYQGTFQNRVQWSAVNDATTWTAGLNLADLEDLPEGGVVTGITGGQYGLIFQENRITRMDYRGGAIVFSFRRIEDNRGAIQGKSIIKVGNLVYFYSADGFYVTDGNGSKPIGNGKVDRFFAGDIKPDLAERVRATHDAENKLIIWSYPSVNLNINATANDKMIIYHYESNRWSLVELDHEVIFNALSQGSTLEQLDSLAGTDIDAMTTSFDDAGYSGGLPSLKVFDATHFLGDFSGSNLEATLQTGESEIAPNMRALVTGCRPIVDTDAAKGFLLFRDKVASSSSTDGPFTMHTTGTIPFHRSARYFKIQLNIPSATTWSDAQGLDIEAIQEGYR
tara:strand:- start:2022 stop:3479 length:1458 start_codon:yes stop_codon:yes gene_type:complete